MKNFYSSEKIAFDPTDNNGKNYTLEYSEIVVAKTIPAVMLKTTQGKQIQTVTLNTSG